MKFRIVSFGYDGGPLFPDIESARKELNKWKSVDLANCRKNFRSGRVKVISPDSFQVIFGLNLYSSHSIVPV